MYAALIGIVLGISVIIFISLFKKMDKPVIYALILSGIGLLYVGFTWRDIPSLLVTSVQAVCFLFLAHYGVKKNLHFLIAGYFLHGVWDLVYDHFSTPGSLPPHYDLFCLSIDFTMGIYLLVLQYNMHKHIISGRRFKPGLQH